MGDLASGGGIEMHTGAVLVTPEGRRQLGRPGLDGGQIKFDFQEIRWEGEYRVDLAHDGAVVD